MLRQIRYRVPLVTNVDASSAKLCQPVWICPFSAQLAVSGFAPVPSSTYGRIAQTSSPPAAK